MPTASAIPQLPLVRYRLTFQAEEPARLPSYSGSAWRGAFGRALKRLVCVTREPTCPGCLLYRSCVYPYVFETPPDPTVGKLRKYTAAPHPFVLLPDLAQRGPAPAGAALAVELTLFGRGNHHLPYLIHAFDQAGRGGIGHARLALDHVTRQDPGTGRWARIYQPGGPLAAPAPVMPDIPPYPGRAWLLLDTPLRLRVKESYVTAERFHAGLLLNQLVRRISLLTAFHTDTPLAIDFAALTRQAADVEACDQSLRWHDWTRYSGRQDTLLKMGGLLGTLTLTGAALEPFWPYLWLGQWTHVGKGTSMGLGKYRLEPT